MTKHTPTPWVVANGVNIIKIGDKENGHVNALIATAEQVNVGLEAVQNAAFIVRACNAHDELVNVLDEYLNKTDGTMILPEVYKSWFIRANKALAKAKE